jgi:hypothetical protein
LALAQLDRAGDNDLVRAVHRDLVAYSAILAEASGQGLVPTIRIVAPMLALFIGTDRRFAKAKRSG